MKKRNSKIGDIAKKKGLVLCPVVNITYSERNKYLLSKHTRFIRYKIPRS